jgi:hypothetical protein
VPLSGRAAINEKETSMSEPSLSHDYFEWAKQQLAAIQATLVALEGSAGALKDDARRHADEAIARLHAARDDFKARIETARTEAVATNKAVTDATIAANQAAWTRVETAFQDFLKAAADNAAVVQSAIATRTEAQRAAWQTSLQSIRAHAVGAIDHARGEADAAFQRLSAETDKAGTRLGGVSAAGDESWKAIKAGLEDTAAAFERTWKKVYESVSNIR